MDLIMISEKTVSIVYREPTHNFAGKGLLVNLVQSDTQLVATTPVFLMATAGLRMVGEAAKDAILQSVCTELSASGFLFRCEWGSPWGDFPSPKTPFLY